MRPGVIWITGLSGAGKTTLAKETIKVFNNRGIPAIHLDGDKLREIYPEKNLYEKLDRIKLSYFYSDLAYLLASQGFLVIVSVIALFKEIHNYNAIKLPNFFLVYLKADLKKLMNQNSKNIYDLSATSKKVVGLNIEFDSPKNPHMIINDFLKLNPTNTAEEIHRMFTYRNVNDRDK